ncbi:MAG: hypothetical protein M3Y35_07515 [Actinomycetota bacterium]|nr:hypothetical protein [Actinomycetota bacterium]
MGRSSALLRLDRRWAGLILLVVALVAAAVIPNLRSRAIPGAAAIAPVAGPPSVGQCLLESNNLTPQMTRNDRTGEWSYAPVVLAPCRSGRYGEVIAVLPAGQVSVERSGTLDGVQDKNLGRCHGELDGYVDQPSHTLFHYWRLFSSVGVFVAGPTDLQRSMGQKWLACIGYIDNVDGQTATFNQSLNGIYRPTTTPPEQLAYCVTTLELGRAAPVDCHTPHQAELFAFNIATATPSQLDSTCTTVIRQLTGMSDPTAAGRLRVAIIGPTSELQSRVCALTTVAPDHHRLAGPLTGIGNKPVPWK